MTRAGHPRRSAVRGHALAFQLVAVASFLPIAAHGQSLVASVLPTSRAVQIGTPATVFASVINTGIQQAVNCSVQLPGGVPATLTYQTTNSSTNELIGTPNTPVSVPPNQLQSFLLAVTPNAAFQGDVQFSFDCDNTTPATPIAGVNTMQLSARAAPSPDVIALASTPTRNGIAFLSQSTGVGFFAVATFNVGVSGPVTARVVAGSAGSSMPISSATVCETDSTTGLCKASPRPAVSTGFPAGQAKTFGVFAQASGNVPLDPVNNRIFLEFVDAAGVSVGSTSVAVATDTGIDTFPPNTPAGVSVTQLGESQVGLSWQPSMDVGGGTVAGYRIYRNGQSVTTVTGTSYTNTGLASGTVYSYTISAIDSASPPNESFQSSALRVRTLSLESLQTTLLDDFNDGSADGWTQVDDSVNGSIWQVQNQAYRSVDPFRELDGSYHLGAYAYPSSLSDETDYRFTVDITPQSELGEDVGVVFRFKNKNNYYRFSINSNRGFRRLEKVVNGEFTTLARDSWGYIPGERMSVLVELVGPLIRIEVDGEPVFGANDSSHSAGAPGLYSRSVADFDNFRVTTNSSRTNVVFADPTDQDVFPNGPKDVELTAVATQVPNSAGSQVRFTVDGKTCGAVSEASLGVYNSNCPMVQGGNHVFSAEVSDQGAIVDIATRSNVGVGSIAQNSHSYVSIGDSITNGTGDNYASDNLAPGRTRTLMGWPSIAEKMLNESSNAANKVVNEGIAGDTSEDVFFSRLDGIIERNPNADRALVMLGTNDAHDFVCDVNTNECADEFQVNMLSIIDELRQKGFDEIIISMIPSVFGRSTFTAPFPEQSVEQGARNQNIIKLNNRIVNVLTAAPDVKLGPDFFSCFLTTRNRFSLFAENLHPNGLGYSVMAALWNEVLSGATVTPGATCNSPVYILEDVSPYLYKQNLLEEGDQYYTDATNTLRPGGIPSELQGGIWVMTANADVTSTADEQLSFDVGTNPVSVYVAYDGTGLPPTSSTLGLSPTALTIGVTGGVLTELQVQKATDVTGLVSVGGARSAGPGARENYIVIVVPQ